MNKSTNNKVEKFILGILKKKNINDISGKLNFLELGIIDSLDFVKLILEIEKKFKIKFTSQDICKLSIAKMDSLKKLINKKLNCN